MNIRKLHELFQPHVSAGNPKGPKPHKFTGWPNEDRMRELCVSLHDAAKSPQMDEAKPLTVVARSRTVEGVIAAREGVDDLTARPPDQSAVEPSKAPLEEQWFKTEVAFSCQTYWMRPSDDAISIHPPAPANDETASSAGVPETSASAQITIGADEAAERQKMAQVADTEVAAVSDHRSAHAAVVQLAPPYLPRNANDFNPGPPSCNERSAMEVKCCSLRLRFRIR
jgi:hypothetical protein